MVDMLQQLLQKLEPHSVHIVQTSQIALPHCITQVQLRVEAHHQLHPQHHIEQFAPPHHHHKTEIVFQVSLSNIQLLHQLVQATDATPQLHQAQIQIDREFHHTKNVHVFTHQPPPHHQAAAVLHHHQPPHHHIII